MSVGKTRKRGQSEDEGVMICKVDGDEMAEYTPYNPDVVEGM